MYQERKAQWIQLLQDPGMGPLLRLQLLEQGSEYRVRRSFDASRLGLATDGAAAVLIGPDVTDAEALLGSRLLKAPEQSLLILEQLNYWYEEAASGALTPAINGGKLKLTVGGEELPQLPEFTLNNFHRGDAQLRFGALPIGIVVPPEEKVVLTLTPSGTAGGSFNAYVSLLVRLEPRWLMDAAGISLPRV